MRILKEINLDDVVFIDIETVRVTDKLEKDTPLYDSWEYKLRYSREGDKFDGTLEDAFLEKAALFSEFAKIVCISIGKIKDDTINIKSYASENEKELLSNFCNVIDKLVAKNIRTRFAGHAINGFDLPFIMRRCIINGLDIPSILDTAHLKPWELTSIDTLTLWRSTSFYGASLLNIAVALDLPSPKSDINGADVSDVYWRDKDIKRISEYCERDVITVANIVRKIRGESVITNIVSQKDEPTDVPVMERIFNTKKVTAKDKKLFDSIISEMNEEEKGIANTFLEVTLPKTK